MLLWKKQRRLRKKRSKPIRNVRKQGKRKRCVTCVAVLFLTDKYVCVSLSSLWCRLKVDATSKSHAMLTLHECGKTEERVAYIVPTKEVPLEVSVGYLVSFDRMK